MNKKEIKNFAKKIVKLELALRETTDKTKQHELEEEIMKFSSRVASLDDMILIDEEVQDELAKLKIT